MPLTVAPSTEACAALIERINTGAAYALDRDAKYSRNEITAIEEIDGLEVDVIPLETRPLRRMLNEDDYTSLRVAVWIRKKLTDREAETLDAAALLALQIYARLNNYSTTDRRVRVWEVDDETDLEPNKEYLQRFNLFWVKLVFRVEVQAET